MPLRAGCRSVPAESVMEAKLAAEPLALRPRRCWSLPRQKPVFAGSTCTGPRSANYDPGVSYA